MLSPWVWVVVSSKAVTERNVVHSSCVYIELEVIITESTAGLDGHLTRHQKLREGEQTLSPERTTCFASIKELYRDDLVQWTTRLFFLLRCSCLLAFVCTCRSASAAPTTEAKATMKDTCCDMLLSERKHPTLAGVPSEPGRPRSPPRFYVSGLPEPRPPK